MAKYARQLLNMHIKCDMYAKKLFTFLKKIHVVNNNVGKIKNV